VENFTNNVQRAAMLLGIGKLREHIVGKRLLASGLTSNEAFLLVKAAKVLLMGFRMKWKRGEDEHNLIQGILKHSKVLCISPEGIGSHDPKLGRYHIKLGRYHIDWEMSGCLCLAQKDSDIVIYATPDFQDSNTVAFQLDYKEKHVMSWDVFAPWTGDVELDVQLWSAIVSHELRNLENVDSFISV
jgi:hypothetical protein